jgi:hypothetical protein
VPLPKPLSKKAPKKQKQARAESVMHELAHGPVNAPSRKATSGKQRQKQNVAIMLKNSGQSNRGKKVKKA